MDHETLFLVGICLLPLAFVGFVSAWTHGHRPVFASTCVILGAGLIAFVAYDRPEGMFPLAEIPTLTTQFVARVAMLF